MKLRLPELKKELKEEDIKPWTFWEDGKQKIYPVIDDEEASIELSETTLWFGINNDEAGRLYGYVKINETNFLAYETLLIETDYFDYTTKAQLKSAYKKCRKELLQRYRDWVSQFYE